MNKVAASLWGRAQRTLATAKAIVDVDPDSGASRAYYAAFYAVSALFALEGRHFTKHSAVAAAVHRDLVKSGKWLAEMGEVYSWLLRLRQTGDYGGEGHVEVSEAKEAVEKAAKTLRAVQDISPEPLPDEA